VKDATGEVISATMKPEAAQAAFGVFENQHAERAFFVGKRFSAKPFWTSQYSLHPTIHHRLCFVFTRYTSSYSYLP